MNRNEIATVLADLLRKAKEAALAADQPEDGGTCNFDAPAFRVERCPEKIIQQAAEQAGVSVSGFSWFGGKRWYWLNGITNGQANRRTRMVEAAMRVLDKGEELIPNFQSCGYCQAD